MVWRAFFRFPCLVHWGCFITYIALHRENEVAMPRGQPGPHIWAVQLLYCSCLLAAQSQKNTAYLNANSKPGYIREMLCRRQPHHQAALIKVLQLAKKKSFKKKKKKENCRRRPNSTGRWQGTPEGEEYSFSYLLLWCLSYLSSCESVEHTADPPAKCGFGDSFVDIHKFHIQRSWPTNTQRLCPAFETHCNTNETLSWPGNPTGFLPHNECRAIPQLFAQFQPADSLRHLFSLAPSHP